MSKFNLDVDPDKFELATVVTKNSRTGITSNKRLLVIRRGHLYYYSNIPKSFTGQNVKMLEHFHELPKCSIEIINIIKINGFEPSSSYFSIQFQEKNMMEREDIRKTLINQDYNFTPKNSVELVTWQFTCDNQIIKQRWVSALNALKEHYQNQQAHMQKYFQTIQNVSHNVTPQQPKNSSFGSFSSNRSSLKVSPWRQSLINRKSYSVIDSKYGIQMKQGNPKQTNKIDFPQFLKKQKSEGALNKQKYDFELIIQQSPPNNKIEEKYKISNPPSPPEKKKPPPIITQQSQEEYSIPQTPIKEETIKKQQNFYEMKNQIKQQISGYEEEIISKITLKGSSSQTSFYQQNSNKHIQSRQPSAKSLIFKPLQMIQKVQQVKIAEKPLILSQVAEIKPNQRPKSIPKQKVVSQSSKRQQKSSVENEVLSISKSSVTSDKMQGSQFHWLLGESCKTSIKFNLRLQIQKQLISHLQWFKHKVTRCLSEWINNKSKGQFLYKTSEQSNKIILVEVGNLLMKIGLLTTQNLVINGKPRIFFNEDSIKNLKRQYKIYQNLFKLFIKRLKLQPSLKIRMPLCCYMQYKGIVCIAFQQNQQQQTIQLSNDNQWLSQKNVFYEQGYKLDWFNFKTINKYLITYVKTRGRNLQKDDENLKQYLKKIIKIGSSQKNHNIFFESPINKDFLEIARRQNASTSIQSLQRYIKGLKMAKQLQGECPKHQIIPALEYCLYCKQLRKLYRSAQGQIDETHFFNLVFKRDQSILNLLEMSNCTLNIKMLGQVFSFIQHYFGIIFDIDGKVYENYLQQKIQNNQSRKSLFLSSTIYPIIRQLPIEQLQIQESFYKLQFYINTKHHLALPALQKKKMIYRIKSQNMGIGQRIIPLYDEAAFYYSQSDFVNCIKKCKQYQQNCPYMYTKLFSIYLLLMKAYSQFSQPDFTITLKKLTQLMQYNYGYEHSSMINLFSLASFYYFKFSKQNYSSTKSQYLITLGIKLMKKAEQMCKKHFGYNSKQYLDILLDFSRLYQNIETNVALKYLQQAKKLCQSNVFLSNPQNLISIFIYQTDLHLRMGNFLQAQTSLLSSSTLIQSKISPKALKHLSKVQYQFGVRTQKYNYCEQAIQMLWNMSNIEKIQALQYAYKTALLQSGLQQIQNMTIEKYHYNNSRQDILLEIQRQKSKHNNLVEMIINWIQQKNNNFLMMLIFVINLH